MLAPAAAHAQQVVANGYSADVEFIRPTFGYGSFYGTDVPMTRKPLTFRYGAVLQYQRDPVTLYDRVEDAEQGAVVTNRGSAQLGASLDLSERFTMSLLVPTALNWGTEIPQFAADGFGLGDVGASGRVIIVKTDRDIFNFGARVGLILPTGRQLSYIGEGNVRPNLGLLAATNLGPVRLATDAGIMSRGEPLTTNEDFTLSSEFQWSNGVRVALPAATRTAFTGQVMTRNGLANFLQGGAENSVEALGGIQVLPSRSVTVDVGIGRGLTEGMGTTDMCVLGALMVQRVPKPPPVIPPPEEPPPPVPPPPPLIVEDEPEPLVFEEGELAKVHLDEIKIVDMPEFVVNTNILKGERSFDILAAVATILNEEASIGHIVIEGHASQEGSFDHNYELSESRARRIYEELIKAGVPASRVSYRGKGEVEPIVMGEDEASLQANRRVEFHIVRQYADPAEMPDYPGSAVLPWNGELIEVISPPKPVVEEPEDEGPELDEFGLPIGDDDEEFELETGPLPPADTGDTGEGSEADDSEAGGDTGEGSDEEAPAGEE